MRPAQTVELAGCDVMAGALFTVSNAPFEVAVGAQVPETIQRYRLPSLAVTTPVNPSVAVVHPE
ncbi:hypothetical protein DSECCO2_433480 [anaerobic digester metagenome]